MKISRSFARSGALVLGLVVLGVTGCAGTTPTIDTGPDAEITFDGLHSVSGTTADAVWARPGIDLSQYSKIMLRGVGVEYRPGGEAGRSFSARSQGGPFEVTPEQRQGFEKNIKEAFLEELAKSEKFQLVDQPGPDVLFIVGGLLDVVSFVPPDAVGTRSNVYLSRVGEATLILEIQDSITQSTLVRAVDRRAAERGSGGFVRSSTVTNRAEVRRLARSWAYLLRTRLDELASREN